MKMRKVLYTLILIFAVIFNYGCKKDLTSEGVSRLTYYVAYDLKGGTMLKIPVGQTFVDPGFTAKENTTDVTSTVKVTGSVDGKKAGYYELKYSAVNSDGLSSSITRTVIIYDPAAPATDFSGDYLANVSRLDPYARAFTNLKVNIKKLAPGFFYVSDFLGGFYDQGSNYKYGPDYAMSGYFQLNPDNTITLLSSYDNGFGDSLDGLVNGLYNPSTLGISWTAKYASKYNFVVNLTLVQE